MTASAGPRQGLQRPHGSQFSLLLSRPPSLRVSDCVPRCAPQRARPGLGASSLCPGAAPSLFCSPVGTEGRHLVSTRSRAVEKREREEGEGTGKGVQSRPGGPRCRVSTRSPSTRIRPTGRPPPGGSGFPAANPLARSTRADGEGATLQAGGAGPGPRPSPELLLSAFGSQPWSRACRSLTVDFLPVVPGTVTLARDGGWGTRHHSRLEQPFPNRTFLP